MTPGNQKIEEVIKKLLSLVGFFDLDPNRVLDIILSAFENDYTNLDYLQVIKIFHKPSLPHILGFRFQNQFSLDSNSELSQFFNDGSLQDSSYRVYIVAAQLIKYGYLNMEDLLAHLSSDEKMEEFYLEKINLSVAIHKYYTQMRLNKDVVITEVKAKEKEKEDLNELKKQDLKNQKFILLSALVRVNDFYHSEVLFNLYNNYFDPLSNSFLTKALCDLTEWMIEPLFREISLSKIIQSSPVIKNENHYLCDTPYSISQLQDPQKLIIQLVRILKVLSVGLSSNIILFTKICRLIKHHSKQLLLDQNNVDLLSELIIRVFLPSLSLIEEATPGLVNDIWNVLSEFETSKRYQFYHFWMTNGYRLHPRLYVQQSITTKETNKWLKTLEKETYRQNGRKLGVLTNSNPCIVFDISLKTILSYDNQIPVFISTLSYCSNLSYDIISFIILKLLSDPSRELLHITHADISMWLISLANFVGLFYKKQHTVEFSALLLYLASKLKNNSTIELILLKELLSKMSGWPTLEDLNDMQIGSFAGGLNLIFESMNLSAEIKNLKKSNQSLLNFFLSAQNNAGNISWSKESDNEMTNGDYSINPVSSNNQLSLAFVFLVLLGEKRNFILYKSDIKQLKLVSSLYDKAQYVFVQFGDYLSHNTDISSYSQLMPNIPFEKYPLYFNCSPEVVFFIFRPCIKAIYDLGEQEYRNYILQFRDTLDAFLAINRSNEEKLFKSNYLIEDKLLNDTYKKVWNYITPEFYFIFWGLRLKDIYFPSQRYEQKIEEINKEVSKLNEELKNGSSESQSKVKKEIEKLKSSIENLKTEMNSLMKNNESVVKFLESKKNILLDEISSGNKRDVSRYFIQYCLFPRMIFSKTDALYSAKILILMIKLEIKSLNILDMLSKIIKIITPTIICVTEYEAQNIGIFLNEFLKSVSFWLEEKNFEKECKNNVCFSRLLEQSNSENTVGLSELRRVNNFLLSKKTIFIEVFQSKEYMSCRNALIVLHSISNVYPISRECAEKLHKNIIEAMEKLSDYRDLQTMAKRYTDNLLLKMDSLPPDAEVVENDNKEKKNGEKSNKKKHSKERKEGKESKKKDHKEESSKTPEIKKRPSPGSLEEFKRKKKG